MNHLTMYHLSEGIFETLQVFLINELYKRNEFVVINKKIKTSARLYKKHGVWKIQYHFLAIYLKRWNGATAEELYEYYKKHI